jgi:catechol 2,3-dioxygenase-like lactoylglutathione lyase family enzyme
MMNRLRLCIRVTRRFSVSRKGARKLSIAGVVLALMCGATRFQAQDALKKNSGPRKEDSRIAMKIKLSSVYVDDQDKALKFYTEVLGFVKKRDIPVGEAKWLTVVSPEEPDGTELLLEPGDNPATRTFKKALFEQGIPLTAFAVDDVQKEFERMKTLGVVFKVNPTDAGPATIAVFDDTCGNLIQIYQVVKK